MRYKIDENMISFSEYGEARLEPFSIEAFSDIAQIAFNSYNQAILTNPVSLRFGHAAYLAGV